MIGDLIISITLERTDGDAGLTRAGGMTVSSNRTGYRWKLLVCDCTAGISYYNVQTSGFRYFGVVKILRDFQEMGDVAYWTHVTDLQFDANG